MCRPGPTPPFVVELVRALSAASAQTRPVESASSSPATPVPPLDLVRHIKELRALLDEIFGLTEARGLWAVRTLSQHVDLALLSPTALISPQNQVDFVDEVLDAVWEAAELGFGGLLPAPSWEEAGRRQQRLEALRARLEGITDLLSERLEAWRRHRLPRL
jgi:hypothetical protein